MVALIVSRIPYGMRGLKFGCRSCCPSDTPSHPIRDAWIEITRIGRVRPTPARRIPYGMRGLKYVCKLVFSACKGRIPYGMRGLKLQCVGGVRVGVDGRIPYGMRGLKCIPLVILAVLRLSHPIRDAWIEINSQSKVGKVRIVASHTGCVD